MVGVHNFSLDSEILERASEREESSRNLGGAPIVYNLLDRELGGGEVFDKRRRYQAKPPQLDPIWFANRGKFAFVSSFRSIWY